MKRITLIILVINWFLSVSSQKISWEKEFEIITQFETDWSYFRMLRNPLIPDSTKYVDDSWANPYRLLLPPKMQSGDYRANIKISNWGEAKNYSPDKFGQNQYVDIKNAAGFYLIEKQDGLSGIKKKYFSEEAPDSMHVNIYDSIFPYDNRFLARNIYIDGKGFSEYFSFHSGNAEWGEWKDAGFIRRVDYCGYIRGVQFGIENVFQFNRAFSDTLKNFRPDFPDYVYTQNRYPSLLTNSCVIIAAPEGREDRLIEYIYYSNVFETTGDTDETHFYEMRYILPTDIKSVTERRQVKRILTNIEKNYIQDAGNQMYYFIERNNKVFEEETLVN